MNALLQEIDDASCGPLRETEEGFEQTFRFPADFIGFSGHYPEKSIFPAFVEIIVGCHMMRQIKGGQWKLSRVKRAKFTKVLGPEMDITARMTIESCGEGKGAKADVVLILEESGEMAANVKCTLVRTKKK